MGFTYKYNMQRLAYIWSVRLLSLNLVCHPPDRPVGEVSGLGCPAPPPLLLLLRGGVTPPPTHLGNKHQRGKRLKDVDAQLCNQTSDILY